MSKSRINSGNASRKKPRDAQHHVDARPAQRRGRQHLGVDHAAAALGPHRAHAEQRERLRDVVAAGAHGRGAPHRQADAARVLAVVLHVAFAPDARPRARPAGTRRASAPRARRSSRSCGRWAARRAARGSARRSAPARRSARRGRRAGRRSRARRRRRAPVRPRCRMRSTHCAARRPAPRPRRPAPRARTARAARACRPRVRQGSCADSRELFRARSAPGRRRSRPLERIGGSSSKRAAPARATGPDRDPRRVRAGRRASATSVSMRCAPLGERPNTCSPSRICDSLSSHR